MQTHAIHTNLRRCPDAFQALSDTELAYNSLRLGMTALPSNCGSSWATHGVSLLDLGRAIDLRLYGKGTIFVG